MYIYREGEKERDTKRDKQTYQRIEKEGGTEGERERERNIYRERKR